MLDLCLVSMYETREREKTASALHSALMQLPKEELLAISLGQSSLNKLAYGDCSDSGEGKWLDQFQGSPLYDQALQLEQQCLQLDMQRVQSRQERDSGMDAANQQQDVIRVQKRMLELQLAQSKHQGGAAGGEEMMTTPNGAPPPVAETPAPAAAGEGAALKQAGLAEDVTRKYPELAKKTDAPKAKTASGVTPGQLLAMRVKLALAIPGGGQLLQAAKNVGQLGLHMAQKNPTAALGLAGAGAGALAGGPGHRLSGAMGGAALGAGVGQMPQISGAMMRGANILSR